LGTRVFSKEAGGLPVTQPTLLKHWKKLKAQPGKTTQAPVLFFLHPCSYIVLFVLVLWLLSQIEVAQSKQHFLTVYTVLVIITQNWNQFLLVVKATVSKQQIWKFYPQIQCTDASDHI